MNGTKAKHTKHSVGRTVGSFVVLLLGLALLLAVVFRQEISDRIVAWQFQPSAQVAGYADSTGMNDRGKLYYFASKPQLMNAQEFNKRCGGAEEMTAVLGCFTDNSIYIYNVDSQELAGIHEVTAAHEMMHAAYLRLPTKTKQELSPILRAEFKRHKSDPVLTERMELYDESEPGRREEELYAIFATEYADLPAELEQHYSQFFADRSKTVELYSKYSTVFRQLEKRMRTLETQVNELASQVNHQRDMYEQTKKSLEDDITQFRTKAESDPNMSVAEYNRQRSSLLARADALEAERLDINAKIDTYRQLQSELESVVIHVKQLNTSIDSKLQAEPQL